MPAVVLPPVGVEVVVEAILNIVSDLYRSIVVIVLNTILEIVPLGLVKAACYILVVPELTDVIPIFSTVRLKIRQFALILLTPILPKLLVFRWRLRSV